MNVFIKTFGCQMNEAESDSLSSSVSDDPLLNLVDNAEEADFIVCNTCSVRRSAEEHAEGFVSQTRGASGKNARFILTGCMAASSEDELKKKFPFIDYFVANSDKDKIIGILRSEAMGMAGCYDKSASYCFKEDYHKAGDIRSYVPIQNGCNNFCSYCIVPYARGREISRDFDQIIDEIRRLDEKHVRIVTLLGQNVNSYKCGKKRFADLVASIAELDLKEVKWIYFDSPHIKDFSPDLLDALASSDIFAKCFHVPVQSFSSSVLRTMNRHETQEDIYSFFELARKKIPGVQFTTDIMVGFPTETQRDFEMTLKGMKDVSFIDAFMYYYNPRKGTAAYSKYKDMDLDVKRSRLEEVIALQGGISLETRKAMLGSEVDVVAVKPSRKDAGRNLCYTESNCAVLISGDMIECGQTGRFVLKELGGRTFLV